MAGVLFFKADPAHAGIQRIIDAIELLAGSPLARGRTSIARTRPHEPLHHRVQSTAIDLCHSRCTECPRPWWTVREHTSARACRGSAFATPPRSAGRSAR